MSLNAVVSERVHGVNVSKPCDKGDQVSTEKEKGEKTKDITSHLFVLFYLLVL